MILARIACAFVATVSLAGCPTRAPQPVPPAPDDTALRMRVAQAEVRRGDGIAELVQLARGDDAHAREPRCAAWRGSAGRRRWR